MIFVDRSIPKGVAGALKQVRSDVKWLEGITQTDSPSRWEYLQLLCLKLDEMEQIFATTARPFLYGVDRHGGFKRII